MRRTEAADSTKPRLRDGVLGVILLMGMTALGVHLWWPSAQVATKAQAPSSASAVADSPYIGVAGGDPVDVWLNEDAMDRAFQMWKQGVQKTHPELLDALVACTVPGGTKVIEESGVFAVNIEVTDGPDAGCQGTVDSTFLHDSH